MKNLLLLTIITIFFSCGSDNLSNSKAEGIISECLEKEPIKRTISFKINKAQFSKGQEDDIFKYKKLKEDGYIEMTYIEKKKIKTKSKSNDPLEEWRREAERRRQSRYEEYQIKLTKKGQKHIEKARENTNNVEMKAFKYEVDKVLEVQEIPAMNTAKVKVQYKAVNITPFATLSRKDPAEFWIKDITMTKTSNGWKYCDNF